MTDKYLILTIFTSNKKILVNPLRCDYVTTNSIHKTVIVNKNEPDLVVTESFSYLISKLHKKDTYNYMLLTNKEDNKKVLINPIRVDFVNSDKTGDAVFINKGQPMLSVKESFNYVKRLLA